MFSFPSLFHRCKYCTNFLSETGLRKKAYLHACFEYMFFSFMKDAFSQDAPIPSIPWNVSIIERSARRVRTLHTIMQQRGHFFFYWEGEFLSLHKTWVLLSFELKSSSGKKCLCWLLWTVSRGVTACTYMGNFIQKPLNEFKCWLFRSVKISGFAWPWQC